MNDDELKHLFTTSAEEPSSDFTDKLMRKLPDRVNPIRLPFTHRLLLTTALLIMNASVFVWLKQHGPSLSFIDITMPATVPQIITLLITLLGIFKWAVLGRKSTVE